MDLLIDTQILVWFALGSKKMPRRIRDALEAPDTKNFVSAVIAFEFSDLNRRGRFDADIALGELLDDLEAELLDMPAEAWRIGTLLPMLHRDPVDRMLIAHALHADLALVTADQAIRDYPVRTLW